MSEQVQPAEEVVDAKDFKIQSLTREVEELKREILRLNKFMLDAKYFATVGRDAVISALDGEAKKPNLRDTLTIEAELSHE